MEYGRIPDVEIATRADVRSSGSVRVHKYQIKKTVEDIKNQED
jgi:hypothetical protein